jgi:SecD/SecF fusion protein
MSVENGFLRSRWTILDSNLTTIFTALILYNFGTGPIKGFGLTLALGNIINIFTSLFVSKLIFDILTRKVNLSEISIGKVAIFVNTKFPFMRSRYYAYVFSSIFIVAGLISLVVHGGPRYSIDFLGGSLMEFHFEKPVAISDIRDVLKTINIQGTDLSSSEIKLIGDDKKDIMIRIIKVGDMNETSTRVKEALQTRFSDSIPADKTNWLLREEQVGPSMGAELKGKAWLSILYSLIMMIIYIGVRFDFKFSLGALLSLVHDVTITVGIFSLLNKEISLTIIAALLTIVGYSINDTIVVFDRIREKLRKGLKESYLNILNAAINETLSRTTITNFTVFLSILTLFFFGGVVIHDFAFALILGSIFGTFSSIFVATPLVVELHLWAERKKAKK